MKMFGFLFLFFFSASALAQNPLIRICNLTNGQFHAVNFSDDQVGFCQYGLAVLDAPSILEITSSGAESLAIRALKSSKDTCTLAGGKVRQGLNFESQQLNFCEFKDGSLIELSTLKAGASAPSNSGLIEALNVRF